MMSTARLGQTLSASSKDNSEHNPRQNPASSSSLKLLLLLAIIDSGSALSKQTANESPLKDYLLCAACLLAMLLVPAVFSWLNKPAVASMGIMAAPSKEKPANLAPQADNTPAMLPA